MNNFLQVVRSPTFKKKVINFKYKKELEIHVTLILIIITNILHNLFFALMPMIRVSIRLKITVRYLLVIVINGIWKLILSVKAKWTDDTRGGHLSCFSVVDEIGKSRQILLKVEKNTHCRRMKNILRTNH